jgi:hypothetical protein
MSNETESPAAGVSDATTRSARNGRGPLYGAIAALATVVVLLLVWVLFGNALFPIRTVSAPTATPVATSAAPTPSETPSPTASPVAAETPLPATCGGLFSVSMANTIKAKSLVLNPAWSKTQSPGPATLDSKLAAVLKVAQGINCYWLSPQGGSGVGIVTRVVHVTPAQSATIIARMKALHWSVIAENGGHRWYYSHSDPNGTFGESHFVRADVWFATRWLEYGPNGYTADMVKKVFG